MREGEGDFGIVHLFDDWASAVFSSDLLDLHDLDRMGTSSMTGSHITEERKGLEYMVKRSWLSQRS